MITEADLTDILLPGAVQAAVKLTRSRCPRTSALAWRLIHRYLCSPVALAATMQADDPAVAELHAELLQWVAEPAVTGTGTDRKRSARNRQIEQTTCDRAPGGGRSY